MKSRQPFKLCIADAAWFTPARGPRDCAALCPDTPPFLHYDPDRSGHLRSGYVSAFRRVGGKCIQPAELPKAQRGRALGGVAATRITPKKWDKRTLSAGRVQSVADVRLCHGPGGQEVGQRRSVAEAETGGLMCPLAPKNEVP